MSQNNRVVVCAVLATAMVAQVASAQYVTNVVKNSQGMGVKIIWSSGAMSQTYDEAYTRNDGTSQAGKAWIQFDLSNAWATYGQNNLVAATLTLWGANGTGRQFDVSGLADNSGLENWNMHTLTWDNAPGNNVTNGSAFDWSKVYGGAPLWSASGGGVDVSTNNPSKYSQNAYYTSPDLSAFLKTDTDGKVTFMWSGSVNNNNQNWWVGTNGTYLGTPVVANGAVVDSPTLTLRFQIGPLVPGVPVFTNVLSSGAGIILRGANGPPGGTYQVLRSADVTEPLNNWSSAGSWVFDPNGNFSFTDTVPADASGFYRLQVTSLVGTPVITVQPQSLNTLAGSTAIFAATAVGAPALHYQWYCNTNTVLEGQTNATLILTNVQSADAGAYSLVVTNPFGSTASDFADLAVNPPGTGPNFNLVGWATLNGGTTGGAGGTTQTVSTASALQSAAQSASKMVVQVSGTIDIRNLSNLNVANNKTIVGLGTNATLLGDLGIYGVSNVIVQNLHLINLGTGTNNAGGAGGGDGITMEGSRNIWIDHCTFSDCADGQCDITHACDFVTVSWCRFYYTTNHNHNFANLVGHSDDNAAEDTGHLRVTFHHDWWDTLCKERMPRVRFGKVHLFNNYYSCTGNDYCIGVGVSSHILLESSYFDHVNTPWANYSPTNYVQGLIHWNNDNDFINTPTPTWAPNSTVFAPPYSYALDPGSSVKTNVINYAGVGKGPFAP